MRPILILLCLLTVSMQLQAEVPHRNSFGVRTSLAGYGLAVTSVQAMDRIGGELGTFSFQARLSKAITPTHQVQIDVTRYTRRSLESWARSSRYRVAWSYRWQSSDVSWSTTVRLGHRDVPGSQHQRAEVSLQASKDFGNWSPYLSGQVRYHLTDSYLLTRRVNLGTNYALAEAWTMGLYLRHGQTKRVGLWDSPSAVLGTSLSLRF